MPRKLIPRKLQLSDLSRYFIPEVIDHLASNYVMGTLSRRVKDRIDGMRSHIDYRQLNERILYWEQKLSPLDNRTPEQTPLPKTWQNIQRQLGMEIETSNKERARKASDDSGGWLSWASLSLHRWATAFSLMLAVLLGTMAIQKPESTGAVSYVAVLANKNQAPQVVATSYANSRDLRLNILSLPDIDTGKTYELWVTSKTDGQARSLGAIPVSEPTFNRILTKAEWGLIKDSDQLLITVEAQGGSATGKPSDQVVSSGLCIRLTPWASG